jgi:peptidoglycan hydrolase-like protein with peptidoglycan-binding domain
LDARGFDCGLADGKFGAKTQEAVIAYQTAAGLQNDGVVGSATWAALLEPEQGQAQEADGKEEDVIIVDDDEEEETDIIAEIMKRLDSLQ